MIEGKLQPFNDKIFRFYESSLKFQSKVEKEINDFRKDLERILKIKEELIEIIKDKENKIKLDLENLNKKVIMNIQDIGINKNKIAEIKNEIKEINNNYSKLNSDITGINKEINNINSMNNINKPNQVNKKNLRHSVANFNSFMNKLDKLDKNNISPRIFSKNKNNIYNTTSNLTEREEKEEEEKEEKKGNNNNINKAKVGDLSLKKTNSKNKSSTDNKKSPILLDLIKSKPSIEVKIIGREDNNNSSTRPIKKKSFQKDELAEKNIPKEIPKKENDKNEYIKSLKSRIVMVDGKMTIEKPDIELITKKYNEEANKDSSPRETKFVSKDEHVVNSLSFLKIEHTKKWSEEETQNFYKALELFGLDFSFLAIVLAPRKRDEIKRKYLKEKKENPKEIDRVIFSRKSMTKLNKVLNLYKKQNAQKIGPISLSLSREASSQRRKNANENTKEEVIDYNKEYHEILNKN
jgi:transcription factor TFIIIB component B''